MGLFDILDGLLRNYSSRLDDVEHHNRGNDEAIDKISKQRDSIDKVYGVMGFIQEIFQDDDEDDYSSISDEDAISNDPKSEEDIHISSLSEDICRTKSEVINLKRKALEAQRAHDESTYKSCMKRVTKLEKEIAVLEKEMQSLILEEQHLHVDDEKK